MALPTDKFKRTGNQTATTLSAPGHTSGGTTITVGSTSRWPTTTGVVFAIDMVTLNGTEEVQVPNSYTLWNGVVTSATTIGSMVLSDESPNSDQDYPAGSLTRVYMPVSAGLHNDLVEGLLVEHTQTGTHGAVTATSVNVSGTVTTDTIAEKTAAAGVTIDGLQIKDNLVVGGAGKGVKNTSLDTTAGELGGAWVSWTPTWTSLTVGNGTVVARYQKVGKTVRGDITFVYGSTSSITGTYPSFSLPVTAATTTQNAGIAMNSYLDNGTAWYYGQFNIITAGTASTLTVSNVAGSYASEAGVSSTIPMTWATGDKFISYFEYEAA